MKTTITVKVHVERDSGVVNDELSEEFTVDGRFTAPQLAQRIQQLLVDRIPDWATPSRRPLPPEPEPPESESESESKSEAEPVFEQTLLTTLLRLPEDIRDSAVFSEIAPDWHPIIVGPVLISHEALRSLGLGAATKLRAVIGPVPGDAKREPWSELKHGLKRTG